LVKNLKTLRSSIWLLVFVLILFIPVVLEFAYLDEYAPILQRAFPFWRYRTTILLLSDLLFLQGGALILFGALVAGVILYNAWGTNKLLFRKYIPAIWNSKVMEQERRTPAGLAIGLILLGSGIIYIIIGIIITI
jgi:hypothetical protein